MTPPILSVPMKKIKQSSLVLTLSATGLLIGGGVGAYWFFNQGQLFSRNLLAGANIIPHDALFAVSLTTDPKQWQKLQEFGTKETQAQLNQNLVQLRDRFLTNHGYNFEKDIQPWVGDEVTLAILAPEITKSPAKPVSSTRETASNQQSMVMVLPVRNPAKAKSIFAQPKTVKPGTWVDRNYQGITIKQNQGETFSAAFIDGRFLVITDNPKATERTIDAYQGKTSLATTGGFAENFPKIASYQPLAQFYINVPKAAKIAASAPQRRLPAQVLTQLQNNQGLAGSVNLESEGLRIKGVSWLKPNSQRVLAVENKVGSMQNRLPAETLIMLSGANLRRLWGEYVLTSQGNPLSPIPPEQLRSNIKSLTNLDLERDLLSWMQGEFAVSVIPSHPKPGKPEDFRAALVFMIQASNRQKAEASMKQLDDVMKTQYQFQIQSATVAGKPVINWISPFGTLTATHGWLEQNVAFLIVGAPITDKILPKPSNTLASNLEFQQTVPIETNPANSKFYLDVEQTTKNFPLPKLIPQQTTLLSAIRTIGVSSAVSDNRSTRYDIFLKLKKTDK
ncbi:Protein of unknown function (DUF3352) [Nostoc sp. PCC 7524]|uniref:DUF3352 domain-containing protein n=1 Tax=Nostoc sp. (strain ATCC 29411 / PCC 7524) TaxID=28072 RepID=UPI00029F2257|nr:DUF3352 domain-containing protein [Nostoc sp. PCC 7524]AFY49441.1 Protein of unknown function (DUF3352) [Nostoc sp. PCC 7524]